ncbi:MAG: hypothetical protein WBK95_10475 [Sulfurimonas sp.]|nr:hypothetical protein [Sulfurimonas sp.]MDD3060191.1 hypothetical protein [Sulfurimonas sp.]MDD5203219.1 hypothetical protein [Sulfurimonas sp.]
MYLSPEIEGTLHESLLHYYKALEDGDLSALSSLMHRESYFVMLHSLGFKRVFRDENFKTLLTNMHADVSALQKVVSALHTDLLQEDRRYKIEISSYEPKGADRVTVHYLEDGHTKKMYFEKSEETWKINFKAGRSKVS